MKAGVRRIDSDSTHSNNRMFLPLLCDSHLDQRGIALSDVSRSSPPADPDGCSWLTYLRWPRIVSPGAPTQIHEA